MDKAKNQEKNKQKKIKNNQFLTKEERQKMSQKYSRTKDVQHEISPDFLKKEPFRFVKKYKYKFDTYCKKRWIGRKLVEVLATEFSAFSAKYYEEAIKSGNITIDKKKVNIDHIFQNSEFMEHTTVRLEPPVLCIDPQIVFEDDKLLVVNKPPSMLCHAGAGSNYNTLQGILVHILNKSKKQQFIHRLDKYTSGLVMISKVPMDSVQYHKQGIEEKCKKYFARVYGEFPENEIMVDKAIYCDDVKLFHFQVCDIEEEEAKQAKKSKTVFNRLWYDEKTNTSLLECVPHTGRTHQIRVHLKHLGFPIINDLHYGGKFVGNLIIRSYWPEIYENKEYTQVKYTDVDQETMQEFLDIDKKRKAGEKLSVEELQNELQLKNVMSGIQTQDDLKDNYQNLYDKMNNKIQQQKDIEKLEQQQKVQQVQDQSKQKDGEDQIQLSKQKNDKINQKFDEKIENINNINLQQQQDENQKQEQIIEKTDTDLKQNQEEKQKEEQKQDKNQVCEKKENNNNMGDELTQDKDRQNDQIQWNFRDHVLEIYLHSYQYKMNNQLFVTEKPYWTDINMDFPEGFK